MPGTPSCVARLLGCVCWVMCSVFVQGFYQNLCDYIHDNKKKWENRNLYVTAYNIFCCVGESLGMSNFVLTKFTFQLNFLQDILQ